MDFIQNHSCQSCNDVAFTDEILSSPITGQEIQNTITHLKYGKAPGEDGIPSAFLSYLPIISCLS